MKFIFLSGFMLIAAAFQNKTTYTFDENHGRLSFSASHFGVSNVEGTFRITEATMKSENEDFSDAKVTMKADARSVNTGNEKRDQDLRSADWLNVEKHPQIVFTSKSFKKTGAKTFRMSGDLTIQGITKPAEFEVVYNGKALNPMSKKNIVGFTVNGMVDRTDFNVGTDAFAKVVGKKVEVRANAEFIINAEGTASR